MLRLPRESVVLPSPRETINPVPALIYRFASHPERTFGRSVVIVDLVQTTTRDGVRLDGIFQSASIGSRSLPLDAVCFVHGTGSNFYSSTLFDAFAERLLGLGSAVLRINTRGHDLMSTAATGRGGRRLGAAYEIVEDCRHDLAAWTEWLAQRSGPRVALIGHSLGAVKCLYALAHEPKLPVCCAVAVSPPRLSYEWFCSSPEGPAFLQTYAEAEEQVRAGHPAALLEVKLPLPFVVSAAGYLEKYGPDERYNYLRFVGSVSCPVLLTFGEIEVRDNMAFRGAPQALAEVRHRAPLAVEVVPGADHFYTGVRDGLLERVASWLRSNGVGP
jgi:pimeloyl-ACP methyl ester carboxylesterase